MDGEDTDAGRPDARRLFEALRDHEGPDAHTAVVVPWLERVRDDYRPLFGVVSRDEPWWEGAGPVGGWWDPLKELYALSRVSDALLLAFQPVPDDRPDRAAGWARISRSQYLELFTGLGMTPFGGGTAFDSFLHEIVEVEQTTDPRAPIEVTGVVWPGLMLGRLLFGRAGVRVRAGAGHARRGIADRSPLYWTYLRRHRPTVDLSQGWGHNSQWRTDFRLDYRTPDSRRLNAAARGDIDEPDAPGDPCPPLTPAERRELLRHRCLLREPAAVAGHARTPGWERELFPFRWRLLESEERRAGGPGS
ncbi:hypothetical protein ACIF70_38450 [Actinacidiphila glaucinigra]|uniref:hypothetical protein n=1 Tax=Actinacidiphila glaucinigra TaxID=235986 RepID=UPI0037C645A3